MNNDRLNELIHVYRTGFLNPQDAEELWAYITSLDKEEELDALLQRLQGKEHYTTGRS